LTKEFGVKKKATIIGSGQRKMGKVIVPNNRKVIVEGVSSFMLSDSKDNDTLRNIGYYKGKKQQQLVLIFNNDTPNDFNLELFNPSMPLDYLFSTSSNLNSQIQVAGGNVEYSDVLFNILANPLMITSATFTISGTQATPQKAVALQINDKFVNGAYDYVKGYLEDGYNVYLTGHSYGGSVVSRIAEHIQEDKEKEKYKNFKPK
jgi:hypothetical protein